MPPRKSNVSIASGTADEGARDPNASSPVQARKEKERDELAIEVSLDME